MDAAADSVDLLALGAESFEPHRGSTFTLHTPRGTTPAVLDTVTRGGTRPGFRNPFSLTFLVDRAQPQAQNTYALTHPVMGRLELFLVPIQPTPTHARYEAVFG